MAQNSSLENIEFVQPTTKAEFLSPSPANSAVPLTIPNGTVETEVHNQKDYFVEKDGVVFAGSHILLDLWGAKHLDNQDLIERALRTAADACGATLLHVHLHQFSGSGGVSGIAVLAESHISVHTWPERNFAAFDIFMCGKCDPMDALPTFRDFFEPTEMLVDANRRGIVR